MDTATVRYPWVYKRPILTMRRSSGWPLLLDCKIIPLGAARVSVYQFLPLRVRHFGLPKTQSAHRHRMRRKLNGISLYLAIPHRERATGNAHNVI